jgi:M6 family metalloprotease-like protein
MNAKMILMISFLLLLMWGMFAFCQESYAVEASIKKQTPKNETVNNHLSYYRGYYKVDPYLIKNNLGSINPKGLSTVNTLPPAQRQGFPSIGTVKVPVFLVDFPDYPHSSDQTIAEVNSKLFGNGDSSKYPFDSMRNYYIRSSYGQLTIKGTVYGWYKAKHNRNYYNDNEDLSKEILLYYDPTIDFSQYDNDNNGILDSFYVFWTGPDYSQGLWYCGYVGTWYINPNFKVDGKKVNEFVWSRYKDSNDDHFATITSIHETAHLMGLPDYYNGDGINWPISGGNWPNGGIGAVDMMDGNADHNCFSKMLLGWIKPKIIASGVHNITLRPSGNSKDAILIMPHTTGNIFSEFFMIQYRKKGVGNDPLINQFNPNYPSNGLVIWHIDASLVNGLFRYNNSTSQRKLLRLMEADGRERIEHALDADKDDFFTQKNTFGPFTYPNSNDYNGNYTGIQVDHISTPGATISARILINKTPPTKTFRQALDNNLNWTTGGSQPWYIQNIYTKDGVDAMQSSHLSASTEYKPWSWISTTLDGPGQLKYWWKLSARSSVDHLRLYLKADEQPFKLLSEINGNVNWQEKTINLDYGKFTLFWFYMKDNTSSTAGLDSAFLDQVTWLPSSVKVSDALDSELNWDQSEIGWYGQNKITHDGIDALQTSPMPIDNDFQRSNLFTTVYGPGVIKFWWKINSRSDQDYIVFLDNNNFSGYSINQNTDWTPVIYSVGNGIHSFYWQFVKSPGTVQGTDAAWIDQIEWSSTDKTPPNISINKKGGNYNTNQIINLTPNEEGTIYYTLDGSTPIIDGNIFSNPLILTKNTVLKYFGMDLNGNKSSIYTQNYIIDSIPPTVTINPSPGIYNTNKTVSLKINEPGKIYYTLNGVTPTINSLLYTKSLLISSNKTIKYLAVDLIGNKSPIYTKTFIIDKIAPTVSLTYPPSDKTGYSRWGNIYIKFTEKILNSNNWNYIKIKNISTRKYISITKTISNNVLSLQTTLRTRYIWYLVTIPFAAVQDQAGNRLFSTYTFRFKTGA